MRADAYFAALERLPLRDLDAVAAGRGVVVVVAPHPDDESLGCGGLIAEACARGRAVRLVVLSDGCGSHPNSRVYPPERLRSLRESETVVAMAELGLAAQHVTFLRLPDAHVPSAGPKSDTEQADLARERRKLEQDPAAERMELAEIYVGRGLDHELALKVADQLMAKDALGAHARDELGISEFTTARPIQAAPTSAATFSVGAALPLLVAAVSPTRSSCTRSRPPRWSSWHCWGRSGRRRAARPCRAPRLGWRSGAPWRWPSPPASATSSAMRSRAVSAALRRSRSSLSSKPVTSPA